MRVITICSRNPKHTSFRVNTTAIFSHARNRENLSYLGRPETAPPEQNISLCCEEGCSGIGYSFRIKRSVSGHAFLGIVDLLSTNAEALRTSGAFSLMYGKKNILLHTLDKHFIQTLCNHKTKHRGAPVYVWWNMSEEEYVLSSSGKSLSSL
jgi:hypothetical protein